MLLRSGVEKRRPCGKKRKKKSGRKCCCFFDAAKLGSRQFGMLSLYLSVENIFKNSNFEYDGQSVKPDNGGPFWVFSP